MSKAISMTLYPNDARPVSRADKEEARMVAIVRLDGMNGRGDEKIGDAGQMTVRCTVNKWGLVSVEAQESSHASTDRDLFYAQVAIDRGERSGVRVVRETMPPARPDGAISLTAAQLAELRSCVAIMRDRAGLGSRRSDHQDRQRAEFAEAHTAALDIIGRE